MADAATGARRRGAQLRADRRAAQAPGPRLQPRDGRVLRQGGRHQGRTRAHRLPGARPEMGDPRVRAGAAAHCRSRGEEALRRHARAALAQRGRLRVGGPAAVNSSSHHPGRRPMLRTCMLGIALAAGATSAQAQGVITTHKLSAALANELVGESVAQCAKNGYKVVSVVVDLDGVRQALLRGDGAPIHSVDNAYYKAYTVASMGLARKEESTKQVAERMAKNAPTTVPQTQLPNTTYAVGGLAIMAGGNTIGGLGISGAPGGQLDEDCGRAALAKIRERMK